MVESLLGAETWYGELQGTHSGGRWREDQSKIAPEARSVHFSGSQAAKGSRSVKMTAAIMRLLGQSEKSVYLVLLLGYLSGVCTVYRSQKTTCKDIYNQFNCAFLCFFHFDSPKFPIHISLFVIISLRNQP